MYNGHHLENITKRYVHKGMRDVIKIITLVSCYYYCDPIYDLLDKYCR